jgi:hypothetical protein
MGLRLSEGVDPRTFEKVSGRLIDPERIRSLRAPIAFDSGSETPLSSNPLDPLPAWLAQVAQWIGFALFKFGVSRGGLEASRLNGMIAHRAHSLCLTISAAPGKGLRHARKRKGQSDRSNDHSIGRSSARDRLRHLGFLFNSRQSQLVGPQRAGEFWRFLGAAAPIEAQSRAAYSAAWRRGKEALSSA